MSARRQIPYQTTPHASVSVVLPCYNYGFFLKETLESLLVQTYASWECIIIDDGSVDDTRDVVHEYVMLDGRFKYFYQQNQGLSAARNKGLEYATGRYIQFIDADDKIQPKKLEKQVAYLESHPDVDVVYGSVVYFGESEDVLKTSEISRNDAIWMPRISGSGNSLLASFVHGNALVVNAALVKASLISDVGYFNVSLRGHEDWEFWIRCVIAGKVFHYLNQEGAQAMVRVHGNSMSQEPYSMLISHINVRNWLRDVLSDGALSKENDYRTALFLLRVARIQMARGEARQAMHSASQAIWQARFRPDVVAGILCLVLPKKVVQHLKVILRKLRSLP